MLQTEDNKIFLFRSIEFTPDKYDENSCSHVPHAISAVEESIAKTKS
jgi:hypothetical protein